MARLLDERCYDLPQLSRKRGASFVLTLKAPE